MRGQAASHEVRQRQLARERRLQTGAAIVLALAVLIVLVLRAGVGNVFPPGWWHH